MAKRRNHDGCIYRRKETKVWWMHYRDRNGIRRSESTGTEDWQEAQKRLRERLDARDNNVLEVVRKGESLSFGHGKLFKATHARREDPPNEPASRKAPQVCVGYKQTGRHQCRPRRVLSSGAPSTTCSNQNFPWLQRTRSAQTSHRTSGVQSSTADVKRRSSEETATSKPLFRRRIPGAC